MGRWVGSMVGGWVILGLILVQLKLEIQLGQNFGNKKKVGLTQSGRYPPWPVALCHTEGSKGTTA